MDGLRFGGDLRLLRIRRGWRQRDLAELVGCSQSEVSRIERGTVAGVPVGRLDAMARALGGRFIGTLVWQGERLDRLRDARHAALVDDLVRVLGRAGWLVVPEVSFSIRGERGAIDVLAFHPLTRVLLVIEVKTSIGDVQDTLSTLDRKERIAIGVAHDRGWRPGVVAVLLAVAESTTNRRAVGRHAATFAAAFPVRGRAATRQLRHPTGGAFHALLFLPSSNGAAVSRVSRVRVRAGERRNVSSVHEGQPVDGVARAPRGLRAAGGMDGAGRHSRDR